ncbi:MAG: UxaA family hydrolase [Deltaproteobacteria bacterium]|nr:UxaA family hydrolase [Deltaproteobacteria bacterium]
MDKKINSILIHDNDNVVTVTEVLGAGAVARYQKKDEVFEVIAVEEIPKFHKIAVTDIHAAEPVFKYGQLIGVATRDISEGNHVHDHNIASPKIKIQPEAKSA